MVNCRPSTRRVARAIAGVALAVTVACTFVLDAYGEQKRTGAGHRTLSLREAVSTALRENLDLVHARLEVQKKRHQQRAVYSDLFPTLNVQYAAAASKYRQLGVPEQYAFAHDSRWVYRGSTLWPDYPYRVDPYRTFTLEATLTQPIYLGGVGVANYKLAKLGVNVAEIEAELARQDLILAVYQTYYLLMLSEKLVEVSDRSIAGLESLKRQSSELVKARIALKVDLLAIETRLAQEELARNLSLTTIEKHTATLNLLMRLSQGTRIRTVRDFQYKKVPYEVPQIYSIAAGNRLEIRRANITIEQALALVKRSQGQILPTVHLQVQGTRTNDDWNPLDPEAINEWTIQGVLSWTFDMFRKNETVKENRVTYAQNMVAREQLVNEIMDEVQQAYLDLKRSEKDITFAERAMKASAENYRANVELYEGQIATYLETLTAETQYSLAQKEYYRSLVQHRIDTAVLERRMGTLQ